MHRADDQLGPAHNGAGDALERIGHARAQVGGGAFAGAVLQVGPGAEGAAGTGEHDGARAGVLLRRLQRGVQVGQQRQADGVQPLGAVQRDDADRAVAVQGGKGHGGRGRAYDQIILTHEETLP